MLYLDTSFIAPIVLPEASSEVIESFMSRRTPGEMAVSHWTRVEFAGLVARRARMKELGNEQAMNAMAVFEQLIADSILVIQRSLSDYQNSTVIFRDSRRHAAWFHAGALSSICSQTPA
jgi:uncharacterized protein